VSRTTVQTAQENLNAAQLELDEARKQPERHKDLVGKQKLKVQAMTERIASLRSVLEQMKRIREQSVGGVSAVEIDKTQGDLKVAEIERDGAEKGLDALQKQ